MTKSTKWVLGIIAVIVVVGLAVWWYSQPKQPVNTAQNQPSTGSQAQVQASETVKLGSKEAMGNFLVDSKGMTLYYFANDKIGKSNCNAGPCLNNWPIFSQNDVVVKSPLAQSDFAQITRDDGAMQTTYKGWPLYYFAKDKQPGDTLGVGVLNTWDVVPDPFYSVMVENQTAVGGNYLIDPKGAALYTFTKDVAGTSTTSPQSNCSGQCLAMWPVFSESSVIVPSSLLKLTDFGTFQRQDGAQQLTYKGWPLYHYASDSLPGDLKGQGFNKVWFVAKQ